MINFDVSDLVSDDEIEARKMGRENGFKLKRLEEE